MTINLSISRERIQTSLVFSLIYSMYAILKNLLGSKLKLEAETLQGCLLYQERDNPDFSSDLV
jgi:hypothetical protein